MSSRIYGYVSSNALVQKVMDQRGVLNVTNVTNHVENKDQPLEFIICLRKKREHRIAKPSYKIPFLYPGASLLADKQHLCRWLHKINYPFYPLTFTTLTDFQTSSLLQQDPYARWFFKPSDESCGRGIHMGSGYDQLMPVVQRYERENLSNNYVIQQQIQSPFLIQKCKCDFRVYLYIDSFKQCVYLCKIVGVRVCLEPFQFESISNKCQLTNVNQGARIFPCQEWNKQTRIKNKQQGFVEWKQVFDKIYEAVQLLRRPLLAYLSKHTRIRKHNIKFYLFGLDFLFDEKCKPYLLEMNDCPQLGKCPLYPRWENAQSKMLHTLLKEVIEPLYCVNGQKSQCRKKNWIHMPLSK